MYFRLAAILILLLCRWQLCAQTSNGSLPKGYLSADSLNRELLFKLDSVQAEAASSFNQLKQSYDSISSVSDRQLSRIQSGLDSLNNLNLPSDGLTHKLDSIVKWKDDKLAAIQTKVDDLKSNIEKKIEALNLPDELSEKTAELNSLVDKLDVTLPDATFPELNLSNNVSLDGIGIENPLSAESLSGITDIDLPSSELGDITEGISSYSDKVSDVIPQNVDDIPSIVEEQVSDVVQLDDVQKQIAEVDQLKEMAGQANNPEAVQEKLQEELQQQAMDHFSGKEQQLEQAMETMSKYKKKYENVQSIADLPKKMPNPLHGKPFVERLVPGIALQIHHEYSWLFDFNPYLGYRFNGRLTAGIGWNQRIAYDFDAGEFNSQQQIFGPRSYGEFLVAKGFSARLELEYMKTSVPSEFSTGKTDEHGREWVFSTMVGLKKDYRFVKNVKGTFMLLYNLYDPDHRSPYAEKLNVRFGFEFPVKRKPKL